MGDLDPLLQQNKNLGIFDLNPLFNAKQEPRYKEDATNGGGYPFDKSIVNATENSDKFEWFVKEPKRKFCHISEFQNSSLASKHAFL